MVNGKWHIDARIGSGGMATVYAATHRNGHRAALKVLHGQLSSDPDTRARFLREAYVANAIDHPAVVKVQDDGIAEDGAVFLVLDLLEGETIEDRRNRLGGALPLGEALSVAEQALDALGAAHDKGIVHRDVKPDNVFLTKDGHAMLLDFGLARMKNLRTEETKTGVTIGTPEFMPPEQAQGKRDEVDARSDVWGLGAMLFTMITGRPVHEAGSLHEQLAASAFKRARPVRELVPDLPASIAVVIDRALELEKADRWESAREMHRALRNARQPTGRGQADDSADFVSESLTLPAASPASMRRNELEPPRSGPRPSGPLGMPVPSSDRTIEEHVNLLDAMPVPSSDKTIDDSLPKTPQMRFAGVGGIPVTSASASRVVPSVTPPISSAPSTERLTGPPTHGSTSPVLTPPPMMPTLSSATSKPDLIVAPPKAVAPAPDPRLAISGPNVAPPNAQSAQNTVASGAHPVPAPLQPLDPTGRGTTGSGPHPVSSAAAPEPGPLSLRARRSARSAVIVCVLLILACAAVAVWVMYGRT